MQTADFKRLLPLILRILGEMIESGGEIYRVEESANRMLLAYGVKRVDIFATTSNIILSIETNDGETMTHTRRVVKTSTDLEKVHKINSVVRSICENTPSVEEIEEKIKEIENTKRYKDGLLPLFYGLVAASFYFFFGGRNVMDFFVAFGVGLITGLLFLLLNKINANKFLTRFVCFFASSSICLILKRFGIVSNLDSIIIGNLMSLIPGVGLTNSLRDLFSGDSISGILRLIEAALLALSIACGYIIASFVFGGA